MDVFWIRTVSQAGIYGTFALYLAWSVKMGRREWVPLLGTVVYALIFEHFNMLRYAHVTGGYSYHPDSWLFLWNDVPLYIPLAWAFIVATSRALTDEIVTREWAKPFCDALLALLIDLSLDIIAIRLHFWTWRGVDWQDGFFGVPADNFLGWLLVTFTFSVFTRALWKHPGLSTRPLWQILLLQVVLLPPAAYLLYLGVEWPVHLAYWLFHAQTLRRQFGVLGGVLAVFVLVVAWGSRSRKKQTDAHAVGQAAPDTSDSALALRRHVRLHGPRHIFHVFALIGFFCLPLAARSPALLLVACAIWGLEAFVMSRTIRRGRGA